MEGADFDLLAPLPMHSFQIRNVGTTAAATGNMRNADFAAMTPTDSVGKPYSQSTASCRGGAIPSSLLNMAPGLFSTASADALSMVNPSAQYSPAYRPAPAVATSRAATHDQDQVQGPVSSALARSELITSQVLSELSTDSDFLFNEPDDQLYDLADLEPLPLAPARMRVVEQIPLGFVRMPSNLSDSQETTTNYAPKNNAKRPAESNAQVAAQENLAKKTRYDDLQATYANFQRFRPYQAEQWTKLFDELKKFRTTNGHCCVPHTYQANQALSRWVKRQRYQYKLKKEGKQSTMTDDRIRALEQIGFIFDAHAVAWEERTKELEAFRFLHGHCNVPSNYHANPQLATWVKCQRRQYKIANMGEPSNMTPDRISRLEKLGFGWELRAGRKK